MSDESTPIAYTALLPGTPVHTVDGRQFGRVEQVHIDAKVDVFDGITALCDEHGARFIDADYIGSIFTSHVVTTLTVEQTAGLPVPDLARRSDAPGSTEQGSSFGHRLRRMFGGG